MTQPKNKFISLLIITGLLLFLTVSLSIFIYNKQQKEIEAQFEEDISKIIVSLQKEITFNSYRHISQDTVSLMSKDSAWGLLPIDDQVLRSMNSILPKGIKYYIYDESAQTSKRFLYAHQISRDEGNSVLQKIKYFNAGNRLWSVVFIADSMYLGRKIADDHWKMLGIGILLTIFIGLNITQHISRAEEIKKQVVLRTSELAEANEDLSRFNRLAVGRELRMVELKKEINDLAKSLGQKPKYEIKE